jgi:hypothetical protein
MMQSSLPGFPRLVEPSNNSGAAASQNANQSARAVLVNFFRFQAIGARLACSLDDGLGPPPIACGDSHHQNKLKS